jgi:hypothetical protein
MSQLLTRVEMHTEELLRKHAARNKRVLYKSGKYNMTAMQRSMRYTSNPDKKSAPGKPPLAHKGTKRGPLLRKLIRFRVDEREQSVVSGPEQDSGSNVPETLDKGGRVRQRKLRVVEFEVGSYGPFRKRGDGSFAGGLLETPRQVERATRIIAEENATRQSVGAYIKPRPFTAPILTDGGENLRKLIAQERL